MTREGLGAVRARASRGDPPVLAGAAGTARPRTGGDALSPRVPPPFTGVGVRQREVAGVWRRVKGVQGKTERGLGWEEPDDLLSLLRTLGTVQRRTGRGEESLCLLKKVGVGTGRVVGVWGEG